MFNWIRADNSSLPSGSYVRDATLYITNAQKSAAGEYICVAVSPTDGVLFTQKAHLRVTGKTL